MSGQQEAATPGRQEPQHTRTDCMQKCSQVPCDGCRARWDALTHAARAEHPGEGSCGLHRWDKEHHRGGRFAAAGSEFTSEWNKCAGARIHSPGKSLIVPCETGIATDRQCLSVWTGSAHALGCHRPDTATAGCYNGIGMGQYVNETGRHMQRPMRLLQQHSLFVACITLTRHVNASDFPLLFPAHAAGCMARQRPFHLS